MTAAGLDRRRRREALTAVAACLGADELELLCLLARRLRTGQRRYGRLVLDRDRRGIRREALEETAEALVYAAALVRHRHRLRRQRAVRSSSARRGARRAPRDTA